MLIIITYVQLETFPFPFSTFVYIRNSNEKRIKQNESIYKMLTDRVNKDKREYSKSVESFGNVISTRTSTLLHMYELL